MHNRSFKILFFAALCIPVGSLAALLAFSDQFQLGVINGSRSLVASIETGNLSLLEIPRHTLTLYDYGLYSAYGVAFLLVPGFAANIAAISLAALIAAPTIVVLVVIQKLRATPTTSG